VKEKTSKNRLIKQKFSKEIPEGDNRERTVCDNCGMIFYENPKVVAGCLLVWEGKILLCKRATEPRSGYWTLPAGFMENKETVEQGA
jgi:NADH pyrophosphatase NudC (nudix superfamily)